MKKIKYLLATLFVGALTLTGCGEKKNSLTAEETAKKVSNSLETTESYKINLDFGIKAKVDNEDYDISLTGDADVDVKNKIGKVIVNLSAMEQKLKLEMYVAYDESKKEATFYLKNPNGDDWVKMAINANDLNIPEGMNYNSEELYKKIFENEKLKQVAPDADNYNYELVITPDDIKKVINELMEQIIANLGQQQIDDNTKKVISQYINLIKGNIKVELSLDKKKYFVSKFKIDVKDILSQTITPFVGSSVDFELSRADVAIKMYDFDKVDTITIPKEALNAQDVSSELNLANIMA